MNIELVTSRFAETKDRLARENQRCSISANRTMDKLPPEHVSKAMASLF